MTQTLTVVNILYIDHMFIKQKLPLIPHSITSGSAHLEILSYCVLCTVSRSSCKYVAASPRGAPRRAASRPRPPGVLTRRGALELASTTPPSRRTCGRGSLRCVPLRAAGAPVTSRTSHDHRQSASQLGSWTCTYTCTRPCAFLHVHVHVHVHVHLRRACASTASRCRASATPRSFSYDAHRTCSASGGGGSYRLQHAGAAADRARGVARMREGSPASPASRGAPTISRISPVYLPYISPISPRLVRPELAQLAADVVTPRWLGPLGELQPQHL